MRIKLLFNRTEERGPPSTAVPDHPAQRALSSSLPQCAPEHRFDVARPRTRVETQVGVLPATALPRASSNSATRPGQRLGGNGETKASSFRLGQTGRAGAAVPGICRARRSGEARGAPEADGEAAEQRRRPADLRKPLDKRRQRGRGRPPPASSPPRRPGRLRPACAGRPLALPAGEAPRRPPTPRADGMCPHR